MSQMQLIGAEQLPTHRYWCYSIRKIRVSQTGRNGGADKILTVTRSFAPTVHNV